MITAKEIQAKSIITKSNLPESDYVINPYTGCTHGCIYCYANFMRRFTGHREKWGDFVDVKINAPDLVSESFKKYRGKAITIGSVCDPYQPAEKEYKITRKLLEKLIVFPCRFDIITKSDLVVRDIDLLKRFSEIIVAFSFSSFDDKIRKEIEPGAPSPRRKFEALKKLSKFGIKTAVFISPIFPEITDWRRIIKKTKEFASEYWFENLNVYPAVRPDIFKFINKKYPSHLHLYEEIAAGKIQYWEKLKKEIISYCRESNLDFTIFFHHKLIKK
jgi:DNA repair photolyase